MARSLTIQHEERATTSPLFTGFLLLAISVLALSAFAGIPADNAPAPDVTVAP